MVEGKDYDKKIGVFGGSIKFRLDCGVRKVNHTSAKSACWEPGWL